MSQVTLWHTVLMWQVSQSIPQLPWKDHLQWFQECCLDTLSSFVSMKPMVLSLQNSLQIFPQVFVVGITNASLSDFTKGSDNAFSSIDDSGDRVAVGSADLQQVKTYVRFWNDTWIEESTIKPTVSTNSQFGDRVFVRGNLVLIGDYAFPNVAEAGQEGRAYIVSIPPKGVVQININNINLLSRLCWNSPIISVQMFFCRRMGSIIWWMEYHCHREWAQQLMCMYRISQTNKFQMVLWRMERFMEVICSFELSQRLFWAMQVSTSVGIFCFKVESQLMKQVLFS